MRYEASLLRREGGGGPRNKQQEEDNNRTIILLPSHYLSLSPRFSSLLCTLVSVVRQFSSLLCRPVCDSALLSPLSPLSLNPLSFKPSSPTYNISVTCCLSHSPLLVPISFSPPSRLPLRRASAVTLCYAMLSRIQLSYSMLRQLFRPPPPSSLSGCN